MSFKLDTKGKRKGQEKVIITIHRESNEELFQMLDKVCRETKLSRAEVGRQCIRYALDNMGS